MKSPLKGPLTARSTSPQSALLAVDPKIIGGTARTIKDLKMEWTTTSAKELALHLQIFDPQIKMNVNGLSHTTWKKISI